MEIEKDKCGKTATRSGHRGQRKECFKEGGEVWDMAGRCQMLVMFADPPVIDESRKKASYSEVIMEAENEQGALKTLQDHDQ
jgi:hypothetical protein